MRRWRKERLDSDLRAEHPVGPVTVAEGRRLLHARTVCLILAHKLATARRV